jgi:hypothetical protein
MILYFEIEIFFVFFWKILDKKLFQMGLEIEKYILYYINNFKMLACLFNLNPPPPGGTVILPEYIHYYG